jgi:hypothetical protein
VKQKLSKSPTVAKRFISYKWRGKKIVSKKHYYYYAMYVWVFFLDMIKTIKE